MIYRIIARMNPFSNVDNESRLIKYMKAFSVLPRRCALVLTATSTIWWNVGRGSNQLRKHRIVYWFTYTCVYIVCNSIGKQCFHSFWSFLPPCWSLQHVWADLIIPVIADYKYKHGAIKSKTRVHKKSRQPRPIP